MCLTYDLCYRYRFLRAAETSHAEKMKQRHAARHAAELAMAEMVNFTTTHGPALAYAKNGISFAKAEQGGYAMAYSGSREKLAAALRAQGMSSESIGNVLEDAAK